MFRKNAANNKKEALLAQKEKILQEIKYYEQRINEFSNKSANVYFGADSSDSDDGFPTFLDVGPSISELKRQDRLLKTCLQATQELTSVTVLESEVQVLVKDPDIGSEKPVKDPGLWREVTAECRIDLVPFSILFYVHQPSHRFAPPCYRGLRVLPVKPPQEAELAGSVLHSLTSPADVLETLRSYAAAYRSRRGSLARLADTHAATLYMQPREEGGFILKCGSVMQMSWRLENKTSPLAPFQHKMNFELEYMDESFLKIVKQAHRQLSNPLLQTDERTQLLSTIINTCVDAQAQESDTDSKKLEKTMLDDNDDLERDKTVMAPPKSIPKRSKPKGKENNDGNRKSVKRTAEGSDGGGKRAKNDDASSKNTEGLSGYNVNDKDKETKAKQVKKVTKMSKVGQDKSESDPKNKSDAQKNKDKPTNSEVNSVERNKSEKIAQNTKNSKELNVNKKTKHSEVDKENNKEQSKSEIAHSKNSKELNVNKKTKQTDSKNTEVKVSKDHKRVDNDNIQTVNSKTMDVMKDVNSYSNKNLDLETAKKTKSLKNIGDNSVKIDANAKNNQPLNKGDDDDVAHNTNKNKNNSDIYKKVVKDDFGSNVKAKAKNVNSNSNNTKKSHKTKKVNSEVNKVNGNEANITKNENSNMKKSENASKKKANSDSNTKESENESNKNKENDSNTKKAFESTKNKVSNDTANTKCINTESMNAKTNAESLINKKMNSDLTNTKKSNIFPTKTITTTQNIKSADNRRSKKSDKITRVTSNTKNLSKDVKVAKIVVKNHRNSIGKPKIKNVESKIPQKKFSPAYAAVLKENPIRISPRMMSKFKTSSDSNIQSKLFMAVTNIPRLLKKPAPKSK